MVSLVGQGRARESAYGCFIGGKVRSPAIVDIEGNSLQLVATDLKEGIIGSSLAASCPVRADGPVANAVLYIQDGVRLHRVNLPKLCNQTR